MGVDGIEQRATLSYETARYARYSYLSGPSCRCNTPAPISSLRQQNQGIGPGMILHRSVGTIRYRTASTTWRKSLGSSIST